MIGAGSRAVRGAAEEFVAAASPLAFAGVSPGRKTGRSFADFAEAAALAVGAGVAASPAEPALTTTEMS